MKDIFDRENEIELLKNSLDSPLIVIMGLRGTGKTSLVKSILNHVGSTYVFLDIRKLENKEYIVYKNFIKILEKEINRIIKRNKDLLSHLRIRGVQIMGISVSFS